MLPAAGVKGERSFGHMVSRVTEVDDATYPTNLRGSAGPLPAVGQLLLPDNTTPPVVPLRTTATPDATPRSTR